MPSQVHYPDRSRTKRSGSGYHDDMEMNISDTPIKNTYNRFATYSMDSIDPERLDISLKWAGKAVSTVLFLLGIGMILLTRTLKLFSSFYFGGMLLVVFAILITYLGSERKSFTLNRKQKYLLIRQSGFLKDTRSRRIPNGEIAAIQLLAFTIGDAYDVFVTTYEVNLVLHIPSGERLWLFSVGNMGNAEQLATALAGLLGVPVWRQGDF